MRHREDNLVKTLGQILVVGVMIIVTTLIVPNKLMAGGPQALIMGAGTCVVTTVIAPSSYVQVEMLDQKLNAKISSSEQSLSSDIDSAEQSINDQINDAADRLNERLKKDDKAILEQLKRNAAAEQETMKLFAQQLRDIMVEAGAAEEKLRAERLFGKAWRIDSACCDPAAAEGIQVGKKTETKVSSESYSLLRGHNDTEYSTSGPNSFTAKMLEVEGEDITAEVLFPSGGVMGADDVAKAQRISEIVTNPAPTPTIPEHFLHNGPEIQAYQAQKKIKESRLIIPQKVFSNNLAAHSATVPLDGWAQNTYERMGGEGQPDGVVDGKMSPMSIINMQVDMRYANPNWAPDLQSTSEKQLLYEMAQMNAVSMEMQRRQLELLQQITLLLAQDQATRVNQEQDPVIRARYNQVINQGNR